jgi:AcrR family transcriptional regulator
VKKLEKKPKPRRKAATDVAEVSPRIARRERRRERSREEIVDAARSVILKKGIAGATLEAVAVEVGLTKAALYYYYPSKESLFFDVMFGTFHAHAQSTHDAVENAKDGGEALASVIRESVRTFAARLDDFRLGFLQGQFIKPGSVRFTPEQFARIRPINDLLYAGATKRLVEEWKTSRGRARVEPRLMVFLAHCSAIGLLTMKGLVESFDDPLIYSDEQLIEGLSRIFEAAAAP